MKKVILILISGFSATLYSQCRIQGNLAVSAGKTETYLIENDDAIFDWTVTSNHAVIDGNNKSNKILVKGISEGTATITAAATKSQKTVICKKEITILKADELSTTTTVTVPPNTQEQTCSVETDNFIETKSSDSLIVFVPNKISNNYKYEWNIQYSDGTNITSENVTPEIRFNREGTTIEKVSVKIFGKNCYKELSKTYVSYFWKFF